MCRLISCMQVTQVNLSPHKENIGSEHICCAFSDKKCSKRYELKQKGFLTPYIGTPGAIPLS